MQVGDIMLPEAMNALPVRGVAVCDDSRNNHVNVVIRTADGFDWYGRGGRVSHYGEVYAGDWTVVYLPAVPLKVGDVIETFEQSKTLPVGTVVVDIDEKPVATAPAIKAADGVWLFWDVEDSTPETTNALVNHRILHIPEVAA